MFNSCKYDSSMPVIAIAASRAVIGSAHFMLISSASSIIRNELRHNPGGGGIDAYSTLRAAMASNHADEETTEEQGGRIAVDPMMRGGMLKVIANYLNDELLEHAPKVKLELSGKIVSDPWAIGDSIADTIKQQIARIPKDLTTAMKMEAKALGVSEEEILAGLTLQQRNNSMFLSDNRELVMECIDRMQCETELKDLEAAVALFDKLPVMDRFKLFAACDGGLMRKAIQEAKSHILYKRPDALGNVGLLNAERRELRKRINAWLSEPKVKREIQDEMRNGATLPILGDLPPLEKEKVRKTA